MGAFCCCLKDENPYQQVPTVEGRKLAEDNYIAASKPKQEPIASDKSNNNQLKTTTKPILVPSPNGGNDSTASNVVRYFFNYFHLLIQIF